MKWLNGNRMRVVLIGFVAVILLCNGSAKGDFTFGEAIELDLDQWDYIPPTTTKNGLLKFFDSNRSGGFGGRDIWGARRETIGDDWGESVNLGPKINGAYNDDCPRISSDGLSLYFNSDRPGGYGNADIYVAMRKTVDDEWGEAVNLGPVVNSSAHECAPSVTADGLELFFAGWKSPFRPGGHGDADIWVTTRATTDDPWGEPVNLGPVVNSSAQDARCYISPDGLMLLFDSRRPGGFGWNDLYMTKRLTRSDPWQEPVNLGPTVNSSDFEECATLSFDGSRLFFDRYFNYNIYQAPILPIVDLNGDRIVDAADMCIMVDHWGTDNSLCDIGPMPWGDGIVDVEDLKVLAEHLFEKLPGRPINQ